VRDLVLLGALLSVFPLILRAPQVGMLAWIWVSLMNPQQEVYGFLSNFQLNLIIAIFTAVAWAFSKERKIVPLNLVTALILSFAVWITITTYFALQRDFSYGWWLLTIKTLILALAILAIATTKGRIQTIIWVMVLSIGYYGVKGGGFTILTGGHSHVFGPDNSMIADNNDLGLALVMILPFMNYLRVTSRTRLVRLGLIATMGLTLAAVIGTYSRGALVALGVTAVAYAAKSRSGIIPLILGGLIVVTLPSLVPAKWFERMSTIQSYNADDSFEGRVQAWRTSFHIATQRPTGGGFSSTNLDWVAQAFPTPDGLTRGRAAHSMYFEVLGDHGFLGLALYLALLVAAWLNTSAVLSAVRDRPEMDWAARLARMMQVSMIGYLVGGAALSMAYYDGFILILTLSASLLLLVRRPLNETMQEKSQPLWQRPLEQDMRGLAKAPGH
jgi:probable O-glycosylation ligase (exosortase A-associated)